MFLEVWNGVELGLLHIEIGADGLAGAYLNCIVRLIGGGTMKIQRNDIAQRLLGLPRDW